ncbi:hypothetical protein [Bacillus taeanensis]|uniref:Uncharacterized protein n=1 Tax=Bacillus taeanensis TaxID=273032 RepID=A0A366XZF5_9BACI|nr:hypothetical protein [Bacillus taeanensis]RBW69544.1 hypothetical protein DS031_11540 [Bacillus taeanensis]
MEQKLIVGFEQFVKEILNKQDETILEVGDFVSSIQSWGYEVMEGIVNDKYYEGLTEVDKIHLMKLTIAYVNEFHEKRVKADDERRNKQFRYLSAELLERRQKIERDHFPKPFYYFHYTGELDKFAGWFQNRLDEAYIASDLSMLAGTIRAQLRRGLDREAAVSCLDQLRYMEEKYNLDILRQYAYLP